MPLQLLAIRRAHFNDSLAQGELSDLVDVSKRVKYLMESPFGLSLVASIRQAQKDIKVVDVENLVTYMNLYDE